MEPKVHYRVDNSTQLDPIVSQMNPVHMFHPISLTSILILSSSIRLCLPHGLGRPPISGYGGFLLRVYIGWSVKLTTHHHRVKSSKTHRAIPPLPHASSWRGAQGQLYIYHLSLCVSICTALVCARARACARIYAWENEYPIRGLQTTESINSLHGCETKKMLPTAERNISKNLNILRVSTLEHRCHDEYYAQRELEKVTE
jgi:hypothetical protein